MRKYKPLQDYLACQTAKRLTLSMQEIEKILADELSASAYRHVAWWSNSITHRHIQCFAWMESGYQTVHVKDTIRNGCITFEKQ